MNKLVLTALFALVAMPAMAQYDVGTKNIMTRVDTMTVDEATANDYVIVNRVSDTNTGAGVAEKIRLNNLVSPASTLTAASTLTTADCGKTLFLNSTTEFATTLPSPSTGCSLKFVIKGAPSGASYTILTASSGNVFIGHVETADIDGAGDGDSSTADDTITFADGVAVVGDAVEMISDGTSWYYLGHAKIYNGITAAQAS